MIGRFLSGWSRRAGARKERREAARLRSLPRYVPATTRFEGRELAFVDAASFLSMKEHIFGEEIYRFTADSGTPRILDGGGNIGMSVIYFKKLYPGSRITVFEPDAAICEVLARNLKAFGHEDVTVIPRALSGLDGAQAFHADSADGGRLSPEPGPRRVLVETARLKPYLAEPVDLLKLDIEGAEFGVLEDCGGDLRRVKAVFIEYHSYVREPQRLGELLNILKSAGFRYQVKGGDLRARHPLVRWAANRELDFNVNVYARRAGRELPAVG